MRILSIMVLSVVLTLMLAPLAALHSEKERDCCGTICCSDEGSIPADPDCKDDLCNPFLCHSCCAKYAINFNIPFLKDRWQPQWLVPASEQISSLFSADFWQPPKLG